MAEAVAGASGWRALRVYLEMIKIEHSIFALPFAMIGMMWGSRAANGLAWPGGRVFGLILVAMVACRSAAMAYNRIADRDVDALNPRTKNRAIPAGLLQLRQVNLFFYASVVIFLVAAGLLNPLSLALSPVALLVVLGYSRTKRFTPLCHFVLGLSLGIAPTAAWVATTDRLPWQPILLSLAVMFWTAGFDILYALQDVDFDRANHLRSLPETVGVPRALIISRICHGLAVCALIGAGVGVGVGPLWWAGVALAAGLLIYEQSLVTATNLSRINMAFFTLNGFVSIGVFLFALADQLLR